MITYIKSNQLMIIKCKTIFDIKYYINYKCNVKKPYIV